MSHKLFLLATILISGFGCGLMDRAQKAVTEPTSNSTTTSNTEANKTLTDKAVDTAVGEKKIGIPECDEAMEMLAAQANDPDDNFVVKAGKKTALNMFREQLKKSLEDNQADKKKVAEFCTEFRDNLKDSSNEANTNTTK